MKSFDTQSIGKKTGSTISLSSISKSFSKKSHVSHFATSVRRKFSENQGKNLIKNVLGEHIISLPSNNITFSALNKEKSRQLYPYTVRILLNNIISDILP